MRAIVPLRRGSGRRYDILNNHHAVWKKGVMNVPTSDLIETARAIRQSYKAKAEKDPAGVIGQEAADAFNKLLDDSKRRCPGRPFIEKMRPVTPGQTQLAGLLAKVDVLEDSLKAPKSA